MRNAGKYSRILTRISESCGLFIFEAESLDEI